MLENGERARPGGSAEAGAAATRVREDCERLPTGGPAEAGAMATPGLENGERAPPGSQGWPSPRVRESRVAQISSQYA